MKQKILFIKLIWNVLTNKESGWLFFKMTNQQQLDFLNNTKDVDINLRYVGFDKRVITKIMDRLSNSKR